MGIALLRSTATFEIIAYSGDMNTTLYPRDNEILEALKDPDCTHAKGWIPLPAIITHQDELTGKVRWQEVLIVPGRTVGILLSFYIGIIAATIIRGLSL